MFLNAVGFPYSERMLYGLVDKRVGVLDKLCV